jgi:hypothetical protein
VRKGEGMASADWGDWTEGRVVAFAGGPGDGRGDGRCAPIAELHAYWEALRNGRAVPLRAEIDPRGIERALEYAFILERLAPQVARFRLAGMHLSDLMGMEVRGMPVTAFFAPAGRAAAARALEEVFVRPAIAELTLSADSGLGRPPLGARMILLPLQSDLGDVSRAIGCLVADGAVGRAPRRFEIARATVTPVEAGKPVPGPRHLAISGFAEPPAPFAEPGRGHLRLIKSD